MNFRRYTWSAPLEHDMPGDIFGRFPMLQIARVNQVRLLRFQQKNESEYFIESILLIFFDEVDIFHFFSTPKKSCKKNLRKCSKINENHRFLMIFDDFHWFWIKKIMGPSLRKHWNKFGQLISPRSYLDAEKNRKGFINFGDIGPVTYLNPRFLQLSTFIQWDLQMSKLI